MADTPQDAARCALCAWVGPMNSGDRPAIDPLIQDDLVRHHVSEHGFPSPRGGPRWEWMTYDPTAEAGLTVSRSLHGILVAYDSTVSVLSDDASVDLLDHLTTVQAAVLSARLRAWADRLDERDVTPREAGRG